MIILGIDPSIVNLGIAVFCNEKLVQWGTLKTKQKEDARYFEIAQRIGRVVKAYNPDVLAIEGQYFSGIKTNSILKTCEVKGVCRGVFLTLQPNGVVFDINPSEMKKVLGVTGKRKEAKQLTIQKVTQLYPFVGKIDDNTADAIGLALACKKTIFK